MLLNIDGSDDSFYRYKMPSIEIKYHGSGNGKKTYFNNINDISTSLHRNPKIIIKYLSTKLNTTIFEKQEKTIINGFIDKKELQQYIYHFIQQFVLCKKCDNPETILRKSSKGFLKTSCKSCGFSCKINCDDERLEKFIIKTT